jgi:hypothetical protein
MRSVDSFVERVVYPDTKLLKLHTYIATAL